MRHLVPLANGCRLGVMRDSRPPPAPVPAALVLLLLFAAGETRAGGLPGEAELRGLDSAHLAACRHYDNRARFKPRGPGAELVVVLADACRDAFRCLAGPEPRPMRDLVRARDFLDRLVALKTAMITINMERLYGPDAGPRARPRSAMPGMMSTLGTPVTATGEYLIARETGVLAAMRAWTATAELARAATP